MFSWMAAEIDRTSVLAPLEQEAFPYRVAVQPAASGPLLIRAQLCFRALGPRLVRELGMELLAPLLKSSTIADVAARTELISSRDIELDGGNP
jgi:hypothetical protein